MKDEIKDRELQYLDADRRKVRALYSNYMKRDRIVAWVEGCVAVAVVCAILFLFVFVCFKEATK